MLTTTRISAILMTFGLTVAVVACAAEAPLAPTAGATGPAVVNAASSAAPAPAPVPATATATATAPAPATSTSSTGPNAGNARRPQTTVTESPQVFICPNGGAEEAAELQRAVDQGHQPWWVSPKDVAAACTFGLPDSTVENVGADTYRVTQVSTGDKVIVNETQPGRTGSTGVWVVTKLTPAP